MIDQAKTSTSIRPLRESELEEADRIFRLAFGTFLGLPDPLMFMCDAGYVRTRWQADPASAFAAEVDGELVGSNFASNWGSVGFFGPVSVSPDLWDRGIGARLVEPAMERFAEWGIEHAGLFTWAHSPKHTSLYQKFGFWARFLTAIMSKSVVERLMVGEDETESLWSRFSGLSEGDREETLKACGKVDRCRLRRPRRVGRDPRGSQPGPRRHHTAPGRLWARRVSSLPLRGWNRGRKQRVLHQVRGDPAGSGRGA
jgi:predicted N-acetyltransferase YhbS